MKNNQEYNHVVKGIPNTKENRDKVDEFNKMAKDSDSMHRLRVRYRKPKKGSRYEGYHGDGCVPKDCAELFSIYLRKTAKQEKLDMESNRRRWKSESEFRTKYQNLQTKYNKLVLKPILQELMDNVENLQYELEGGQYWGNIVNSLKGLADGVGEDIDNNLEV
jgi:hypothetical protein